jgi:NitT/TauT family transport system substrate-binding protein
MNRRHVIAGTAGALLVNRIAPAAAQTPAPAPIRLGYTVNDSGMQGVYARELGIFTQTGLTVELQPFGNTASAAQALVAGAVDVTVLDALQVANAYLRGLPLAIIAGGCVFSKQSPTLVMVTMKASPVQSARDLDGQTIGVVSLKSLSSSIVSEWLRVGGTDPIRVKLFELPFSDMNAALQRGTIAAALQGEPFLTAGKSEQRALGIPFEVLNGPFYVNVYAASREWISKNGPLAHKLTQALFECARFANTHRPETAEIESRTTKLLPETVRTMARNVFATSFDAKMLDPVLDIGARYKLTERLVKSSEIAALV